MKHFFAWSTKMAMVKYFWKKNRMFFSPTQLPQMNMEPENDPFEKKNHLCFWGSKFSGVFWCPRKKSDGS